MSKSDTQSSPARTMQMKNVAVNALAPILQIQQAKKERRSQQ